MRTGLKRLIVCCAAAILILQSGLVVLASSLGEELHSSRVDVTEGTDLVTSSFWHTTSGRQQEYYFESKLSAAAMPVVAYGNKLYGKSTISDIGSFMQKAGYKVVAGINADFFSLETGLPLGMVVTNGILRSSDAGAPAVGFDAAGNAFVGNPSLTINGKVTAPKTIPAPVENPGAASTTEEKTTASLNANGVTDTEAVTKTDQSALPIAGEETQSVTDITIDHVNKKRTPYGLYLLTSDFSGDTKNNTDGYDVILRIQEGSLKIGGEMKAIVESKTQYAGAIAITDDMLVITCDAKGPVDRLNALVPGAEVTLRVNAADARFEKAVHAVSGSQILVKDGKAASNLGKDRAPRSAVGVKANGTLVMYVNDGRQKGYSEGMSLTDLATRMMELGCVDVLNFDGGGSSAISTDYPGTNNLKVINSPSDGSLRKCANYLFLVNSTQPTGVPENLYLYPYDALMMPGASMNFQVRATDGNYHAAGVPGGLTLVPSAPELGSVSTNGTFTAGQKATSGRIWAKAGNAEGYATIKVVDPDEISLRMEGKEVVEFSATPGKQYQFDARAYYKTYELTGKNEQFQWSINGSIGEITPSGLFKATAKLGARGEIVVQAGETTKKIAITVGEEPVIVEDFEYSHYATYPQMDGVIFAEQQNKDFVKYGKSSAKLSFDGIAAATNAENGNIVLGEKSAIAEMALPGSPSYLNLWIYGDGSGVDLQLALTAESGDSRVDVGMIDFVGWRHISVPLPKGTAMIKSFVAVNNSKNEASCKLYMDQVQAAYSAFADRKPPVIKIDPIVTIVGANQVAVTAKITDDGTPVRKENIALYLDGVSMKFDYNEGSGALVASLPAPGDLKLHRVSLEAIDLSGNIGKDGQNFGGSQNTASAFADTTKHWAGGFANFLFDRNILGGEMVGNLRYFYPDKEMSRAELAKIMTNFGGYDVNKYANVSLDFVDVDQIPKWAVPYVKVMLSEGIIRGKDVGGGKLGFDPQGSVTRAEMMTIIGRMQKKGYAESNLSGFPDGNTVPDYAKSYVSTLMAQGVVTGYDDGTLRPSAPVLRGQMAKMFFALY